MRAHLFTLVALASLASGIAQAQYGASPSQTGLFFDDLRARTSQRMQQSGVRGGEVIYDYSRGVYVGAEPEEREMGERAVMANEAMREMGQPAVRSGYGGYSLRAAGDYTQYAGPYPSTTSFFAPTYVGDPFMGGRRNIKAGPVNIGLGASGYLEYNDNITRAHEDPIEDFIASALFQIEANYQITRHNGINLNIGLGFDHYFDHPELAPYGGEDFILNILPGSSIAFDIKAGPVNIVLYDRMSVRPATQSDFALDPTEIFGVFQNDAGIAALWAVNSQVNLGINYMHSDAWSLEDEANIYDRTTDSIHGSLSWSPRGTWTLGLEGGVTWVKYPENFNNDGQLLNAGVFFMTPIGNSTFLRVAGGYQSFDFDSPPAFNRSVSDRDIASTQAQIIRLQNQLSRTVEVEEQRALAAQINQLTTLLGNQQLTLQSENTEFLSNSRDSEDLDDYYYNVTLTNQLNSRITQTLAFGHESALNTTSNFITADYVTYGIGFIAWRGSRVSLSGYYEDAEESGGHNKEDLEQYGFDAYISHQLTPRVRLGVGYHYGNTDSDIVDRDYVQHAINADISFALTRKCSMTIGYRHWKTNADLEENDFKQNRVIMAVNYNFGN
jgi:hypothetical protein